MAMITPVRPCGPVQWYGGKGNLAARLLPYLPHGRIYVEPYCGAASLFFAKPRAPVEVLNDLNGDIVHLFRVLQDRVLFEELRHRLRYTLYARAEFARALALLREPPPSGLSVERAWAFFVAQNQGVSGKAQSVGNWSRTLNEASHAARRWRSRVALLEWWRWRLLDAQIDQRDALDVIAYWDSPETVFYLDPPYYPDTRVDKNVYAHEADAAHHARLVDRLLRIQGHALLSGYRHPVYAPLEAAGWRVVEIPTACHAAGRGRGSPLRGAGAALRHVPRTEVLWIKGGPAPGSLPFEETDEGDPQEGP